MRSDGFAFWRCFLLPIRDDDFWEKDAFVF